MRKFSTAVFAVVLFATFSQAQSYEGQIEYEKKKQSAIIIEYAYPPDAVEGAIVQKMERMGYNAKEERGIFNSSKGFRNYKNAVISSISSSTMDYIVKVERKSKKDRDESVLYLIINKNGTNVFSAPDADVISKAKSFLNGLLPEVESFNLELQIKDQEDEVKKAEKKLKNLQNEDESMEKKIKKLQDDMKQNAKDQEKQQKEIENQKQILITLKAKRKTN
jgi:hypothetical protein